MLTPPDTIDFELGVSDERQLIGAVKCANGGDEHTVGIPVVESA